MTFQRSNCLPVCAMLTFLAVWLVTLSGDVDSGLVGPALAQEAIPTACIALPGDEFSQKAAAILNHVVRENIKREKKFKLVDLRTKLTEGADGTRQKALSKASELLNDGKEEYDNLELDAAIEKLTAAKEKLHEAAGLLGEGEMYMDVMLLIGASHILSGDDELGRQAFQEVAMFDKRKTLDPKLFPPSMIEVFNTTRDGVGAASVATLAVKSKPDAAEVYVNGVFKGITPMTLTKIPEGTHFLRIERDGYLKWGQRVDFFATHEETVDATLKPAPGLAKLKAMTKEMTADMEADPPAFPVVKFGEWMGAKRVMTASVKQRQAQITASGLLIALDPRKKLSYKEAEFKMVAHNFLIRADAFFSSLYRKVKMPAREDGVKDSEKNELAVSGRCNTDTDCATGEVCEIASGLCIPYAPPPKAVYQKWWFWTIIGGVALVGTGVGIMTWYLVQPERGAIEFTF